MTRTLVLAHVDGETLMPTTARLVAGAQAFGQPVDVLVAGHAMEQAAQQAAALAGVDRVLLADDERLALQLAEPTAALLEGMAAEYGIMLGGMSSLSHREALPRLAGRLQTMALSDIIDIVDRQTFRRPAYAGNVITTVRLPEPATPVVLLLRESAFPQAEESASPAPVEEIAVPDDLPAPVRVVAEERHEEAGPRLETARVVLGMGRGASSEEARTLLQELAQRLGAAIAATRVVVDEGLAPGEWQVGQTGKSIAPALYMAFGISGAHQHLAGIRDAGIIVAINTDTEAPIFRAADYGLVMDTTEALRMLLEKMPAEPSEK